MKPCIYILCSLLIPVATQAQLHDVQGVVKDGDDGRRLQGVLIVNNRTQAYTFTNDSGYYKIQSSRGDTVVYMLASYKTFKKAAIADNRIEQVWLQRLSYLLNEVEILPGITRYEKEHSEMLKTYDKVISDANRKVDVTLSNGVVFHGLISRTADKISGKRKKDKRFLKTFEQFEEQKFIAIRYNPEVVISVTGTNMDSAVNFMNQYPMAADFARDASTLELGMWIRNNYNRWIRKPEDTPAPIRNTK